MTTGVQNISNQIVLDWEKFQQTRGNFSKNSTL